MATYYLDASAAIKLFKTESETAAFLSWFDSLGNDVVLASSDLIKIELIRAINRYLPEQIEFVAQFLRSLTTLKITNQVLQTASELSPVDLGTLDAIHLASAKTVCSSNDYFVSYDQQLLYVATQQGLQTLSPGN